MADYLPFVNNDSDHRRFGKYYSDAQVVRVLLPRVKAETAQAVAARSRLWLDPGVDGYDCLLAGKQVFDWWRDYVRQFDPEHCLADAGFLGHPVEQKVQTIVFALLDKCQRLGPACVTVPVLPVVQDSGRNRINRELAAAAGKWKAQRGSSVELVLPLVFTHPDQLKGRTQWKKTLDLAQKCYADAGATMVWAVDSDLSDQMCRGTFSARFDSLVRFHEDLRGVLPGAAKIAAGPYWGMNLVLWARGLCDYPAVSMGAGYRHSVCGAFARKATRFHVALAPLRRWAIASPELKAWLKAALEKVSAGDPVREAFLLLERAMDTFVSSEEAAKEQVARSYKEWFDKIQRVSPNGRTLTLYQDLSSAYVLGKHLPKLPKSEAPGRDAGKVAEQLMLHCL